jgi:hypothetical protein
MRTRLAHACGGILLLFTVILMLGCGGGRTAVVGVGNSGNRIIEGGLLEEVADALAELPDTPEVTDAMLGQIFGAILERANEGSPEAALVVLFVAEEQRRLKEDE